MMEEVIRRDNLNTLRKYKDVDLIKVIIGMRRTGKTTLMRQYMNLLIQEGVPRDNIVYIDMDSIQNDRYRDGTLVYSTIASRKDDGRQYVLIDEVQYIDGWMRVIESLRNDIDCDLYITGSNAHMLSSEISTLLTGRSVAIHMLPLSLKELCLLNDDDDPKSVFVRYVRHGGLPILRPEYSEETTFQIINELKSDIILKDICNRKPGTDPIKIRKVIDYLYSEIGNPISVTKISDKLHISSSTATEYLQLITDSMLFMKAERYDVKGHNVLSTEPKYYCTDTGMRYSQPIRTERDFGKTLENIVYLELIRRGHIVYVGRTGVNDDEKDDKHLEIDFIVPRGDETDYYQVTMSLNDPAVYERELRPLRMATGRGERYVLTYDDRPVSRNQDAIIMNITDFLMGDEPISRNPTLVDYSYDTMYSMLMDYIKTCSKISGTKVDRKNFDELSMELQGKFFDLQAYLRRPELIDDEFLQDILPRIRTNNVRIFNAMVACVNANKEPMYTPVIAEQMVELTEISKIISKYIAEKRKNEALKKRG
jgi:hypothetical protein